MKGIVLVGGPGNGLYPYNLEGERVAIGTMEMIEAEWARV